MTGSRSCPNCREPNAAELDFCANCGEFLDWEPSEERTASNGNGATAATAVVVAPPVRDTAEHVSLRLLRPDGTAETGPVTLTVPAGGRVTLLARVRNQGTLVDSYTLTVEHLPDDWWTIDPGTAYLLPLGSREGFEEDVVIAIHPPRTPRAVAGRSTFTVVATSHSRPTRRAEALAAVDVEPFWQISATARPPITIGRRRGALEAMVINTGNAPVPVVVEGADAEERCLIKPLAVPVQVPPGRERPIPVGVRPKRPRLIGRPLEHRLDLAAKTVDDQELAAPFLATYRQKAWIAWWVPLVLLLLVILAALVYLLWPQRTTVPDVRKSKSAFAAQKKLEDADLTLSPKVEVVQRKGARPGSVIDQAPAAGEKVKEGRAVTVTVAAGRTKVKVPKLKGLLVRNADQRLQKAGLTLGAVLPELDPKGKVASQLPRSGVKRKTGTPVNVVLAERGPAKKDGDKKEGALPEEVPKLAPGGGATKAAAALEKAGLKPTLEMRIHPAKRGTVIGTVPPTGQPPPADGKVTVLVSAGFPPIAYNTSRVVRVAGGVAGRPLIPVARDASVTTGGAWRADGRKVAYVSEGRLYVRTPGAAGAPLKVDLDEGQVAAQVAFAPTVDRSVLVFAARGAGTAGGDAVCWVELRGRRTKGPTCRRLDRWTVDGLAWRPDGRQILAAAHTGGTSADATAHRTHFGLLSLSAASPFSTLAREWAGGSRLVTPYGRGRGVLAAAYSPDGGRLAVVTNRGADHFRVGVTSAANVNLKKRVGFRARGCDVDWRPDGLELAVVQSDPLCLKPFGAIRRVPTTGPPTLHTIVRLGRHPDWRPIDLTIPEPE